MSQESWPKEDRTLKEKFKDDPFYGIAFFAAADAEEVRFLEKGTKGQVDWQRYEFYPRTGHLRILQKTADSRSGARLKLWKYNLRTKHGWAPNGSLRDEDYQLISRVITELTEQGILTLPPDGYPEVEEVLSRAKSKEPVEPEALQTGHYYIAFEEYKAHVFQCKSVVREPFVGDEDIVRVYSLPNPMFGTRGSLEVSHDGEPQEPMFDNSQVIAISIPLTERAARWQRKKTTIYEIDEESVKVIHSFKSPSYDQLTGSEWTRERWCIQVALAGLQYERWGKDEYESSNPDRYKDIHPQNYHQALQIIIDRFGLATFIQECKNTIIAHLNSLHTQKHLPGSPFKPHSDIAPLGEDYMVLANQVIAGSHPLPVDMSESGHVVNAKSLFGDVDFWNFLRTNYPDSFNEVVDFIINLPKNYLQHGTYASAIIDPVALIKQYYPTAYAEISVARTDFDSDTPEAILIQK